MVCGSFRHSRTGVKISLNRKLGSRSRKGAEPLEGRASARPPLPCGSCRSSLRLRYDDAGGETFFQLQPSNGFRSGFSISSSRERWICAYIGSRRQERINLIRRIYRHHRKQFERAMGEKVSWEDEKKWGAFWISLWREADPSEVQDWPSQHRWLKNAAEKLERGFQ
jgi:hypothetical protein